MINNITALNIQSAQGYATVTGLSANTVLLKLESWQSSGSNFSTEQLSEYLSWYYYQPYVCFYRDIVRQTLRFVLGLFGLLGYFLEMAVLLQPEFSTVTFSYYKAITAFELVVMIYMIERPIVAAPPLSTYVNTVAGWAWFNNIWIYALGEPQSFAADTLTMFVSFERTVALWLPRRFRLVNNWPFAGFAIVTAFIAGAIYWLNFTNLYADANGMPVYGNPLTSSMATFFLIKDWIAQIRGWVVLILAILVSAGFLRLTKMQSRLGANEDQTQELAKLNKQLALLSLACSIPVMIQAIMDWLYDNVAQAYDQDLDAAIVTLSFADAIRNIEHATVCNIYAIFDSLSFMASHCTHFYVNFVLSHRFRHATLQLLKKWLPRVFGTAVVPLGSGAVVSNIRETTRAGRKNATMDKVSAL